MTVMWTLTVCDCRWPGRSLVRFGLQICGILWLAVTANPACAQDLVMGVVTSTSGQPVPAAGVELWVGRRRVASGLTGSDGRFGLSSGGVAEETILVVRAIGYSPETRAVHASDGVISILLTPVAVMLDPVLVQAAPRCPRRDSPDARSVWVKARQRNRHDEPSGLKSLQALAARLRVSAEELGTFDSNRLQPAELWIGGNVERRIADSGYAWHAAAGISNPRFDFWQYPYLESGFAHHFVDSLFGRLHTFSLLDTLSDGSVAISFCPLRRRSNRIQGEIQIGPDGSLRKVSWVFLTSAPQEHAGGMAIFPHSPGDGWPVPVPLVGAFWRKAALAYLQEVWVFHSWDTARE